MALLHAYNIKVQASSDFTIGRLGAMRVICTIAPLINATAYSYGLHVAAASFPGIAFQKTLIDTYTALALWCSMHARLCIHGTAWCFLMSGGTKPFSIKIPQ